MLKTFLLGCLPTTSVPTWSLLSKTPSYLELQAQYDTSLIKIKSLHAIKERMLAFASVNNNSGAFEAVILMTGIFPKEFNSVYSLYHDLQPFYRIGLGTSMNPLITEFQLTVGLNHSVWYNAHMCQAYGFGWNNYFQLGSQFQRHGLAFERTKFSNFSSSKVCCGFDHTMLLDANGVLYSCGVNTDGQLGRDALRASDTWGRVHIIDPSTNQEEIVENVVCGGDFTFARTTLDNWYSWGNNEQLQLLLETNDDKVDTPTKNALSQKGYQNLQLGSYFGMAIHPQDPRVITLWGNGAPGLNRKLNPGEISDLFHSEAISKILCRNFNALTISDSGNLRIWGRNHHNMFGINEKRHFVDTPTLVDVPGSVRDAWINNDLLIVHSEQHPS